jgi:hypothetical protein
MHCSQNLALAYLFFPYGDSLMCLAFLLRYFTALSVAKLYSVEWGMTVEWGIGNYLKGSSVDPNRLRAKT